MPAPMMSVDERVLINDVTKPAYVTADNPSAVILASLQRRYGPQKYTEQSVSRYPIYSYQAYTLAGGSVFNFFSQPQSTAGEELCNLDVASSNGNWSYLINSIGFDLFWFIPTVANNSPWSYSVATGDASAPYADVVHGLTGGGHGEFDITGTTWWENFAPFLTTPSAIGKSRMMLAQAGLNITQSGMSPFAVTGAGVSLCNADVCRRFYLRTVLKNQIFMPPQTTFGMSLNYQSGAIPIMATGIITGNGVTPPVAASAMIGVRLDGWRYRPVS